MSLFIQQCITGISQGSIYAVLALALVLINRSTGVLNFAQGEMGMLAAYGVWAMHNHGIGLWLAFAIVLVTAFAGGGLIEYVFIRPLRSAPPLSIVITSLGLFLAIDSIAGYIWGYSQRSGPSLFPDRVWVIADHRVSVTSIGILVTCFIAAVAMLAFFRFTHLGLQMRAAVTSRQSAQLLGIDVDRTMMIGWGLASILGAIAGVLSAPSLFLQPTFMFNVLIYALCAAALGGLDSIAGAVVGGLLLGLISAMATTYISGFALDLSNTVPLVILAVVLVVRPQGLFGKSIGVRV